MKGKTMREEKCTMQSRKLRLKNNNEDDNSKQQKTIRQALLKCEEKEKKLAKTKQ